MKSSVINCYFKLKLIFILFIVFLSSNSFSQTTSPRKISDESINQIKQLNQFQFYLNGSKSLKELVGKISNATSDKVIDSLAHQLVALKDMNSFLLTANLCCRFIDYSKQNELTQFAKKINRQATYRALNKYYLENFYTAGFHPVLYHTLIYESIREKYKPKMDSGYYYLPQANDNVNKKAETDCFKKIQINDVNINRMEEGFYKFEFLNNPAQNRLDTLVNKIENLVLTRRNMDTTAIKLSIDSIGQLKTQSAYCYLYTFTVRKRYAFTHDLNPMDGIIERYGGLKAINTYYLNGKLTSYLNKSTYDPKAEKILKDNAPLCFYCAADTTEASQTYFMNKADTRFQDEKIIETISYFSDLNKYGGFSNYKVALDSISETIGQMPFVNERKYNYCEETIAKYPGYVSLGILFTTNKGLVEKVYKIQFGEIPKDKKTTSESYNRLKFVSSSVSPGFIKLQKKKCGDKDD
ncbi:MAG: hypothetical protein JNJ40_18435 [Bacteroidia bacterium]|nr:hypothetical protein [Bacteroidia bacterium]